MPTLIDTSLNRIHDLKPTPLLGGVLHAVRDDGEDYVPWALGRIECLDACSDFANGPTDGVKQRSRPSRYQAIREKLGDGNPIGQKLILVI